MKLYLHTKPYMSLSLSSQSFIDSCSSFVQSISYKHISSFLNPVFKHFGILFAVSFTTGFIISIYGNTCGIDILHPSSWPFSLIIVGSPWCSRLATLSLWMTTAIENMWVVLCSLLMLNMVSFIPSETVKKAFGTIGDKTI